MASRRTSLKTALRMLAAAVGVSFFMPHAGAAVFFWNTNGVTSNWTSSNWSSSASGPFTSGYTVNSPVEFTANSNVTYVTTTSVGNITVDPNVTVNVTSTGTLTTTGAVRTVDVESGGTLNWTGQGFSGAAGTGFIKSGAGTWNMGTQSGTFPGGFTLNSGTLVVAGSSASTLGTGVLTLNGGSLQSSGNHSYGVSSIVVGGDFENGGSGLSTFAAAMNLGSATRTITNSTVSGSARIYSGLISGAAGTGLTFAGSGQGVTYISSASNSFTGPVTIAGSEVAFASDGSFGHGTSVILNGGRLTAATSSGGTASYTLSSSRSLMLANNSANAINIVPGGTLTYNGVIADVSTGGTFTKLGSGTLSLGGINTYTGPTNINGGTLALTSAGSLNSASQITVNAGGTFTIDDTAANAFGVSSRFGGVTLANTAILSIKGNAVNSTSDSSAGPLTLSGGTSNVFMNLGNVGSISLSFTSLARNPGSAIMVFGTDMGDTTPSIPATHIFFTGTAPALSGGDLGTTAAGILPYATLVDTTITSFATYDGTAGVGLRTLRPSEVSSTVTAGTNVVLSAPAAALENSVSVNSLQFSDATAAIPLNGKTLTIASGGLLDTISASPFSGTGTVDFGAREAIVTIPIGITMTASNSGVALTGSGGLTKAGAGTLILGGSSIAGISGGVTLDGGGIIFSAAGSANNYSGDTTINAGTMTLASGVNNIPAGSNLSMGSTGILAAASNSLNLGDLNGVAGASITSTGPTTLNVSGSGTWAGTMAGSGAGNAIAVTKSSGGVLTVTGNFDSSNFAATTITGGTIAISSDGNLGKAPTSAATAALVLSGGALSASASFTLSSFRGIAVGTSAGAGTGTLDVADGARLTYAGIVANAAGGSGNGLNKTGPGTLALDGANTYDGLTTITGGTLVVNDGGGSGSLTSSDVVVQFGATLGGVGAVKSIALQGGGHGAPGNSLGTQTTGGIAFSSGAILDYDFAAASAGINHAQPGASDRYLVTGAANSVSLPEGAITLNLVSGSGNFTGTGSYELIAYSDPATAPNFLNGDGNTGSIVLGSGWSSITGTQFTISNDGGNSGIFLDFAPTSVPEPASLAMLGLGAAGLLSRRRRD